MGSGGFFVQSEKFIEEHDGRLGNLSVYGQESNPTTWRLAAMNMAIRGIDFNFGMEPANFFTSDQHPDLRGDYVDGQSSIQHDRMVGREGRGRPVLALRPSGRGNANFTWLKHMLHRLAR
jgi:type I restriction enzyme M protein